MLLLPRNRDIGVHFFHPRQFMTARSRLSWRSVALQRELAADPGALDLRRMECADVSGRADQRDRHFIGHIKRLDQDFFVAFEPGGIIHQQLGELIETGIVHRTLIDSTGALGCNRVG